MPITPRLSHRLHATLGPDAAEDLVTMLDEMRAEHRDLKASIRADFAELRQEMNVGFARLETLIERRSADLIKWSFVFWVGAVAAIAMLAGVLG